jgi:hypothetical protein
MDARSAAGDTLEIEDDVLAAPASDAVASVDVALGDLVPVMDVTPTSATEAIDAPAFEETTSPV